jgi:hypothetical protein
MEQESRELRDAQVGDTWGYERLSSEKQGVFGAVSVDLVIDAIVTTQGPPCGRAITSRETALVARDIGYVTIGALSTLSGE